jgi:REP element-mobilizing transposase RayT
MSNHVHLFALAKENNLSDILRDLKKFTSKQVWQPLRLTNRKGVKNGWLKFSSAWRMQQQKQGISILAAKESSLRML